MFVDGGGGLITLCPEPIKVQGFPAQRDLRQGSTFRAEFKIQKQSAMHNRYPHHTSIRQRRRKHSGRMPQLPCRTQNSLPDRTCRPETRLHCHQHRPLPLVLTETANIALEFDTSCVLDIRFLWYYNYPNVIPLTQRIGQCRK